MSDSQKPPHLRHESEFNRKYSQRTLDRIRETGRDDPKSQYNAWYLERQDGHVHHLDRLLRRMATDLAERGEASLPHEEELAHIERLADDVHQMKPFLVRNFRPAKAVVELPGQFVGNFIWAANDRMGCLRCAESEEALLDQEHRAEVELPLGINPRGLLTCFVNPWRTVATHEEPLLFPAISVGRIVLEAVHDRLFQFYDQIDVEAILRRWRSDARSDQDEPPSAEDEVEAIAAAIAVHEAVGEPGKVRGRITSSLRLSQLQSILEGRFGCTARPGKGSELLFYREGGCLAYVARHKANPEVPAVAIQRILKKLKIAVKEWLTVSAG